jgi:hypothetical protein
MGNNNTKEVSELTTGSRVEEQQWRNVRSGGRMKSGKVPPVSGNTGSL